VTASETTAEISLFRFVHPALNDERVVTCCSTRAGGVSDGPYASLNLGFHVDDDPTRVLENRERLAKAIGVSLDSFVVPQQVHQGHVHVVTRDDRGRGARAHETALKATDALVTNQQEVVLAVMLADCVPVVIFDPKTPAIGIAHAGWGGTLHHITRRTVETMQSEVGTDPTDVVGGVGPSIGPETYEVEADVADRARGGFQDADILRPKTDGKFLFDLWASNVSDLVAAGVPREQIEVAGVDTYLASERFFSHRRDGRPSQQTGRFMAVAALRG
jgi:YfiH family protein